jgi:hypothetical protein
MSTKTISKRVALATVVALGAGVLSLVSVSSANAVANDAHNLAVGTASASLQAPAAGVLNIVSANSATGVAATTATNLPGAGSAAQASVGLLAISDIAGNSSPVAGTTQTATLTSAGVLTVYTATDNASNGVAAIAVTGGTIVTGGAGTGPTATNGGATVNSSLSAAANDYTTSANNYFGVSIKPNAGVSSMTVSLYTATYASTTSTQATLAASPTSGTLKGQIVVSVAAASTSGTLSLTKSGVYYSIGGALASPMSDITVPNCQAGGAGANCAGALNPAVGTAAYNIGQYASIVTKDAYGVATSAGVIQASATNGALVTVVDDAGSTLTANGTQSNAFFTQTTAGRAALTVKNPGTTALSTTVTISYNGTVIGTKSFSWQGQVAKVVLSSAMNGKVGAAGTPSLTSPVNGVSVSYLDSVGNTLSIGSSQTGFPTSLTKNAGTTGTGIGLSSGTIYPVASLYTSGAVVAGGTSGAIAFSCGSANATGNLQVDYSNNDGSVITSNGLPVSCSGAPDNYTAKLDKATYNPGDIATLTVTFKDVSGATAADIYTVTSGAVSASAIAGSGTSLPNIAGTQLTNTSGTATNAGTQYDVTTNGAKKYTFIVGTTSGSYGLLVDFPAVDANHGVAQTVAYTIASSGTSLNDVLKGIVSLIASINKQIAALAKLVTKK